VGIEDLVLYFVLLFIALLNSRSGVESYYSFEMNRTQDLLPFLPLAHFSGTEYLSLLITVLIVLITVRA
jgi:hypothetical protein